MAAPEQPAARALSCRVPTTPGLRMIKSILTRLAMSALLLAPGARAQDWNDADPAALAQATAVEAYTTRLAGSLAGSGSARELALAAVLRDMAEAARRSPATDDAAPGAAPADPQAQAWRRAAAAKAGQDILANQLLAGSGAAADNAMRRAAAGRWQAADPGNLYPLLHLDLDAEALLSAAREATHADAHMYEGVRWIMAAYRRSPPSASEQAAMAGDGEYRVDEAAAVSAMGLWTAAAVPGLATLLEACSEPMLRARPARRDDCRHAAGLLADGSGRVGDEHAGLAMLRALATTTAERAHVEERQRALDWRMLQWGRIAQQQPRGGAAQFVRLLLDPDIRTEQQLVARVLAEAGVPSDPPHGWMPPRR